MKDRGVGAERKKYGTFTPKVIVMEVDQGCLWQAKVWHVAYGQPMVAIARKVK
jgi:hypothetical protein